MVGACIEQREATDNTIIPRSQGRLLSRDIRQ
jgi:hypothetical protein